MATTVSFGRRLRLQSLYRHDPAGLLVVPLDHPVTAGPIVHGTGMDRLVGQLAENGADAVVLHKGVLHRLQSRWFRSLALIVQLSAGTRIAPDPDAKYLVASVEEALRAGADGVSVHVNLGSSTEGRQIADLAAVAEACDRWGVPLLAMVYARGARLAEHRAADLLAHGAAVAADLGADLVKSAMPADPVMMAEVARACPIPMLAAGGAVDADPAAALRRLAGALRAGAGGIAAGRLVFTADDPGLMVRRLAALVHDRVPVSTR
ncbi:2-amino-3,7-dideoxy-D-threo-hept-6-ulosonate synthase [Solwaraspora sp. WMMB335]|uniref:2-amino-3,7-dideoxy-D-threo-hept-6-ulosonate synthase n=1 Tax=Solwaraspora sp. WMMB335 TaxID=3404118 RepID=UPI003B959C57